MPEGRAGNIAYALRCCRDSLARGEAPYASHVFFDRPGLLDDALPAEREAGILAGFAWGEVADLVAVYCDRGISSGMLCGIERARSARQPVAVRYLDHERCRWACPHADRCTQPVGHDGRHNFWRCDCNAPLAEVS